MSRGFSSDWTICEFALLAIGEKQCKQQNEDGFVAQREHNELINITIKFEKVENVKE